MKGIAMILAVIAGAIGFFMAGSGMGAAPSPLVAWFMEMSNFAVAFIVAGFLLAGVHFHFAKKDKDAARKRFDEEHMGRLRAESAASACAMKYDHLLIEYKRLREDCSCVDLEDYYDPDAPAVTMPDMPLFTPPKVD